MSRLIKEVKSFGRSALLKLISVLVFFIFFSLPINVIAEEVPYWAGHETELWGDKGFILLIRDSKDGKFYSADIDLRNHSHGGQGIDGCKGKIDKKGNLEEIDCTPIGFNMRLLKGHVTKVIYENLAGSAGGGDVFVDEVLLERKTCGLKPCVVEVEKPLAKATRLAAEAKQSAEAARIEATRLAAVAEEALFDGENSIISPDVAQEQAEVALIEATQLAAEAQQAQRVAEAKRKQEAEPKTIEQAQRVAEAKRKQEAERKVKQEAQRVAEAKRKQVAERKVKQEAQRVAEEKRKQVAE
jgi:flagellar biosynthesis GTPase FlhF